MVSSQGMQSDLPVPMRSSEKAWSLNMLNSSRKVAVTRPYQSCKERSSMESYSHQWSSDINVQKRDKNELFSVVAEYSVPKAEANQSINLVGKPIKEVTCTDSMSANIIPKVNQYKRLQKYSQSSRKRPSFNGDIKPSWIPSNTVIDSSAITRCPRQACVPQTKF